MRKLVGGVLFLVCLLLIGVEAANRYQIFSEKKGWLGLGGKTVIMLDRESGDSWELVGGKWITLPKVELEEKPSAAELKQLEQLQEFAAQLEAISAQQARELADLKAKQEAQLKTLAEGRKALETIKTPAPARAQSVPPTRTLIRSTHRSKVASKSEPVTEYVETVEEGPPGWLRD